MDTSVYDHKTSITLMPPEDGYFEGRTHNGHKIAIYVGQHPVIAG